VPGDVAEPLGVTVKVYDVPFESPVTVQVCAPVRATKVLATTQVLAPGVPPEVFATVYVAATPSATNETLMAPLPAFATVGVARAAVGVIEADAADCEETVLLPLGVTVKVYATPLVSPVTLQLCAPVGATVVFATMQVVPAVNGVSAKLD
jgi:hypothetical protein